LLDFPYSFESERLVIRGPLPGDGPKVRQAVLESQTELRQWMPWAVEIPDEENYEVVIRQGQLRFLSREDLWMLLVLKENDLIVGGSGLHSINWDVPSFEIGYWVRTSYSGQGLITEAVEAITAFAFEVLGANRVQIRCDSLNERSAAVARRAGYELEAVIHNDERHHLTNALRNTLIFARVRT
jgi:ribosomal-protein-serine acetyltransferase